MNRYIAVLLGVLLSWGCAEQPLAPDGGEPSGATSRIVVEVSAESEPLAGVAVSLSGGAHRESVTNHRGRVVFSDLAVGSYTIAISGTPQQFTFQQTQQSVTLKEGSVEIVGFAGQLAANTSIQGVVRADDELLDGVRVTLLGVQNREVATNTSGRYSFAELSAGEYTVCIRNPNPSRYVFDRLCKTVEVTTSAQVQVVDFVGGIIVPPPPPDSTGSITTVVTIDGTPADVTVTLGGDGSGTRHTGSDGRVTFGGLRAGTYSVGISGFAANVSFSQTERTVVLGAADTAEVSFVGTTEDDGGQGESTIYGRVYVDEDGDGMFTTGVDTPFTNLSVSLAGTQARNTPTDQQGQYQFGAVVAGEYSVSIVNPSSSVFSFPGGTAKAATVQQTNHGSNTRVDFRAIRK